MAFVALYDANVLYPGSLRDLLVRLGQSGLFQAKWTEQILDETFAAIVRDQPKLEDKLARTRQLMNDAIADVTVAGYQPLIASLDLPDPDDRHVLAAAIACNAQVIVTANLRHFPDADLEPLNIEARSPDEFVTNVLELAPARVVSIVKDQARALTRPEMTFEALSVRTPRTPSRGRATTGRRRNTTTAWIPVIRRSAEQDDGAQMTRDSREQVGTTGTRSDGQTHVCPGRSTKPA